MVAKEMNFQPVEEENELQDFDDAAAAAETLSLCDLPLNGYASDWDEFSKEDRSSESSFEQDFFEFFSEDFTACSYPSDNIIFCGKLITCRGETVAGKARNLESTKKSQNAKKSLVPPWKSFSFSNPRQVSSKRRQGKSNKISLVPVSENRRHTATSRCGDKYDFPAKKVSILATPIKPRWHLFAFGVGRFPMEMELNDIKMRHSKKSPSRMFQSDNGIQTTSRKREKGSWGLLGLFGCNSSAMPKASLGGAPTV